MVGDCEVSGVVCFCVCFGWLLCGRLGAFVVRRSGKCLMVLDGGLIDVVGVRALGGSCLCGGGGSGRVAVGVVAVWLLRCGGGC